jgi:hypothetical protein
MPVLKGTKNFYDYEGSDILAYNLKSWLEYGLLEVGAYTPIKFNLPTSGYTKLKHVKDDRYNDYQVYEGFGPSWVWENDVAPIGESIAPFQVSGIYINNVFLPTNTSGNLSYKVDYKRGRIIFDRPVTSGNIRCEYTARDISVYTADSYEWKTIVDEYQTRYDSLDTLSPSGMASNLKENRVWIPCIVIDVQNRTNEGLQLGGGERSEYMVFYHTFTDKGFTNKRLLDLISNQDSTSISLFDVNRAPIPLKNNGTLSSGALTYPNLANRNNSYFWTYGYIDKSQTETIDDHLDLFRGQCRQTVQVDRYLSTY